MMTAPSLRQGPRQYVIGADGRLLEWWEDLPEEDAGQRHLSFL